MNKEQELFVKEFAKNLKLGKASFFIGSGMSRPAGYIGWKDVLRDCATEIGLDVEKEKKDLISLAQYYTNKNQRTRINSIIKESFADANGVPKEAHELIASLPITDIWTTNYDTLIERALKQQDILTTIITDDESYRDVDNRAKVKIYKIHGTVSQASKCVITRSDYEAFSQKHDIVLSELKGAMCSKSFLFLGYSFSDTDIQHILTKIRLIYNKENPQRHYCIVEKLKKSDYSKEEDYNYDVKKQEHHISDMETYGIKIVLVDSYDEIKDILVEIQKRVYLDYVCISGAYEKSNSLAENRISPVAQGITALLIRKGLKIRTGYGKSLGCDIVEGGFEACTKNSISLAKSFNENIFLYPFPFRKTNSETKATLYSLIRKNMISKTRIMLIISGEKCGRNSKGTEEEYKIAREQGNLIIPIATTGGFARKAWDDLNLIPEYSDNTYFKMLDKEIVPDKIIKIVDEYIDSFLKKY